MSRFNFRSMSGDNSLEDIRERRKRELRQADDSDDDGVTPDEPLHIAGPAELTEATEQHDVVLVDFYADWCGPCRMLEPVVESLAAETEAAVAKVDVDRNQRLAQEYGVRGVPTLVLFAGSEAVERLSGVREKQHLKELIAQYT
jgi:thioredoxin 1